MEHTHTPGIELKHANTQTSFEVYEDVKRTEREASKYRAEAAAKLAEARRLRDSTHAGFERKAKEAAAAKGDREAAAAERAAAAQDLVAARRERAVAVIHRTYMDKMMADHNEYT